MKFFDPQPIIAFNSEQQRSLSLLYHNLEAKNVPDSSISFAEDLLQNGQKMQLSEKQLYWVKRLGLVNPSPKSELMMDLDKLESVIKKMAQSSGFVNPNTLIFAENLIKKGRRYGQLSEKQRYWVEKLAADGIRRPAAIYCSICNRKGHSSYSCWRRDGRGTGWDSSLKKRIQNRLKSESNELPKQCIYCGNPIDVCICKDSEISNITVENDDYIGNWRKDNMPDFF